MNIDPLISARNALDELGINSLPVVPQEICEKLGITYVERPLDGFEGTLLVVPNSGTLIGVNSQIRQQGRKNFTCAHELGHYYMDVDPRFQRSIQCGKETVEYSNQNTPEMEKRANIFASELLMPKDLFEPLILNQEPGWELISSISEKSQTSLLASCKRFLESTNSACALVVSKNKRINWSWRSKPFKGWIDAKGSPLSKNTTAYSFHEGTTTSHNNFEVIRADNWLSGNSIDPELELLEWSLPLNSYGQVLSFLWDEDSRPSWTIEHSDEKNNRDSEEDGQGPIWDPPTFHRSKKKR